MRKDLTGSGTNSDMNESVFAIFGGVLKTFRAIRWTNASAGAQDGTNQDVCFRGRAVTRSGIYGPERPPLLNDIPVHEAMALFGWPARK